MVEKNKALAVNQTKPTIKRVDIEAECADAEWQKVYAGHAMAFLRQSARRSGNCDDTKPTAVADPS